jgi:S-DNA-T family DNA segregation ATPase FtsK/SpoIIIE
VQGCLVTDEEIEKVTRYLKDRAEPEYDDRIIERQKSSSGNGVYSGSGSDDDDPLLGEAEAVVTQADKASASLLQRRLRVGYARAARLLDLLEERGIVGPGDGAKPRDVIARPVASAEEWSSSDELDDEASPTPEP